MLHNEMMYFHLFDELLSQVFRLWTDVDLS